MPRWMKPAGFAGAMMQTLGRLSLGYAKDGRTARTVSTAKTVRTSTWIVTLGGRTCSSAMPGTASSEAPAGSLGNFSTLCSLMMLTMSLCMLDTLWVTLGRDPAGRSHGDEQSLLCSWRRSRILTGPDAFHEGIPRRSRGFSRHAVPVVDSMKCQHRLSAWLLAMALRVHMAHIVHGMTLCISHESLGGMLVLMVSTLWPFMSVYGAYAVLDPTDPYG